MEAVTACVGFDDVLDVALGNNHPHLDTMIVVTSHDDRATPGNDAFVAVNGVRTKESLKGLRPGESRMFDVPSGGEKLTIGSERLVPGQSIEFDADLKGR